MVPSEVRITILPQQQTSLVLTKGVFNVVVSFLDDRALMRMAQTCRVALGAVVENRKDWERRAQKEDHPICKQPPLTPFEQYQYHQSLAQRVMRRELKVTAYIADNRWRILEDNTPYLSKTAIASLVLPWLCGGDPALGPVVALAESFFFLVVALGIPDNIYGKWAGYQLRISSHCKRLWHGSWIPALHFPKFKQD